MKQLIRNFSFHHARPLTRKISCHIMAFFLGTLGMQTIFAHQVNFTFTHLPAETAGTQSVYAFFQAYKIGAMIDPSHKAETPADGLIVGQSYRDRVYTDPMFNTDTSGTYNIVIWCGPSRNWSAFVTKTFFKRWIPRDGEVLIEASCSKDKDGEYLPPKYHIKIDPK